MAGPGRSPAGSVQAKSNMLDLSCVTVRIEQQREALGHANAAMRATMAAEGNYATALSTAPEAQTNERSAICIRRRSHTCPSVTRKEELMYLRRPSRRHAIIIHQLLI